MYFRQKNYFPLLILAVCWSLINITPTQISKEQNDTQQAQLQFNVIIFTTAGFRRDVRCFLLGCCAGYVPTFGDSHLQGLIRPLTLKDGADMLSRNVDT